MREVDQSGLIDFYDDHARNMELFGQQLEQLHERTLSKVQPKELLESLAFSRYLHRLTQDAIIIELLHRIEKNDN